MLTNAQKLGCKHRNTSMHTCTHTHTHKKITNSQVHTVNTLKIKRHIYGILVASLPIPFSLLGVSIPSISSSLYLFSSPLASSIPGSKPLSFLSKPLLIHMPITQLLSSLPCFTMLFKTSIAGSCMCWSMCCQHNLILRFCLPYVYLFGHHLLSLYSFCSWLLSFHPFFSHFYLCF